MKTKLDEIIDNKQKEIAVKKQKRGFFGAIKNPKEGDMSIIAEIKLASPSAGKLGDEKDLEKRAVDYERGGADAISVVVDKKYFAGELEFIRKIKRVISLSVLAKDFVIDPFQIYEMKAYGADAVLLIAKIVTLDKLDELVKLARELNTEPVVEVQNERELQNATRTDTRIIAVNARNLDTFNVNIENACRLIKVVPKRFVSLGFSGVSTRYEIKKYKKAGATGVLVGTSLMQSKNVKDYLMSLRGIPTEASG